MRALSRKVPRRKSLETYLMILVYYTYCPIGVVGRVFANSLENQGSISDQVLPKTEKMVLDASLLNTQHYKVCIKDKMAQSREWSSTLLYTSVL